MTEEGLRERKKRETRRHIHHVAIALFAERGFDDVKVSDIAAAANVSDKTVFNYFATKEALVLDGREVMEEALVEAIRNRGPGESVLATTRTHTIAMAQRLHEIPEARRLAFRQIVVSTPSVHAGMRQLTMKYEAQLAELLREEGLEPLTAQTVAGVLGQLSRLAFGMPLCSTQVPQSLEQTLDVIEKSFALIGEGLNSYGVRS